MKPNLKAEFLCYLQTKEFVAKSDLERCYAIDQAKGGGAAVLPSALTTFCSWIAANWDFIDTAVLWGSYVSASERDRSFCLGKEGPQAGKLLCGPSDVDALVIGPATLKPPHAVQRYDVIDGGFKVVSEIELNIFRDVIILDEGVIEKELLARRHTYLCFYLQAYSGYGHILKISDRSRRLLDRLSREVDWATELSASPTRKEVDLAALLPAVQGGAG